MLINSQQGIGLIELLVTIVITTVGLLGLSSLQLQANRAALDSGNRSQALWIVDDLTNRMRANANADTNAKGTYLSLASSGYHCPATAPTRCSSFYLAGKQVAGSCSSAQMAASDLYESLCSTLATGSNTIAFNSAADFINDPILTITATSDEKVRLTLSWEVRTSGRDNNANKAIYAIEKDTLTNHSNITLRDQISREVQL